MILSKTLNKMIFASLLGHIIVCGIFSFSFGDRIPKTDYACISFLGQILNRSDLNIWPFTAHLPRGIILGKRPNISALDKSSKEYSLVLKPHLKPLTPLLFSQDKITLIPKPEPISFVQKRKEPIIMFHPLLPEYFLLYFRDRQVAHIELMFNIISTGKINSIVVKRKISSGNLEVDLLSRRYISHYLFIQQARFSPNNWQTVKIDLSAKND